MIVQGFEFPDDVWVHPEHDVWVRFEDDGSARVGISALGVRLSGEIYMCRARPAGTEVVAGRAIAVVELAKSIVSVRAPIGGRIVEVNAVLETRPERVHESPYGDGWIVRLVPGDLERDRGALVRGERLAAIVAERVRLERLDGGP